MPRPIYDHASSQNPQLQNSLRAANLADLYWLVHVVEAGSFSAAAQLTGIAKSNLSRRIIQLEKRMDVQLLIRKPRALHLTPTGSRIYRHALDVLYAAKAVEEIAKDANGEPRGPLHLRMPRILSHWLYDCLRTFRDHYPNVDIYVTEADGETDLVNNHLDISLSLQEVSCESTDIVSRTLARLEMVIVGSPPLVEKLGKPKRLANLKDGDLLAIRSQTGLRPWALVDGEKALHKAALCLHDYQSMLESARASIGLACVPLHSCIADLRAGHLQRTCTAERPKAVMLYSLTNPHRSITPATRALVQHFSDALETQLIAGMAALRSGTLAYE